MSGKTSERPVVRLIKALYGHPEAGGHWELHLTKIIIEVMEGQKVKNHHSCFWFPSKSLLLIVYVDDLLLVGPGDYHDAFWKKLAQHVNIDPYEDLARFLGRHHEFSECDRLKINLVEHFTSPVSV